MAIDLFWQGWAELSVAVEISETEIILNPLKAVLRFESFSIFSSPIIIIVVIVIMCIKNYDVMTFFHVTPDMVSHWP